MPPPPHFVMSESESVFFADHPLRDPALVREVEKYLTLHLVERFSWQTVLDNTTTTRSKEHDGPVVQSMNNYMTCSQDLTGWICTLDLPLPPTIAIKVSPIPEVQVQATAKAPRKKEAKDFACRKMFALLLLADPGWVEIHPCHWKVSPQQLIDDMPGGNQQRQALAPRVRRLHGEPAAAAIGLTEDEVDARVRDILRLFLDAYGGQFDPSDIDHDKVGLGSDDAPVYQQLHDLIGPGQLRTVIDRIPGISWRFRHPGSKSSAMIVIDTTLSDVSNTRSECGIHKGSLSESQLDAQSANEPCQPMEPGFASSNMVPDGLKSLVLHCRRAGSPACRMRNPSADRTGKGRGMEGEGV